MNQEQARSRCPSWADALVQRITELEVQLGNLNPDGPCQVSNVAEVYKRLDSEDTALTAEAVDALFARVCRGLSEEGFAAGDIAAAINTRIPSGRVPYCNESEVTEALS